MFRHFFATDYPNLTTVVCEYVRKVAACSTPGTAILSVVETVAPARQPHIGAPFPTPAVRYYIMTDKVHSYGSDEWSFVGCSWRACWNGAHSCTNQGRGCRTACSKMGAAEQRASTPPASVTPGEVRPTRVGFFGKPLCSFSRFEPGMHVSAR